MPRISCSKIGKSARSLPASSFVWAVTATQPSYPGAGVLPETDLGLGCARFRQRDLERPRQTVRLPAREPRPIRLRRVRDEDCRGGERRPRPRGVDEPEEETAERLCAVFDPPGALVHIHDERLSERRPGGRRRQYISLRRTDVRLWPDPPEDGLLVGAVVELAASHWAEGIACLVQAPAGACSAQTGR